jgi:hypothetical protein
MTFVLRNLSNAFTISVFVIGVSRIVNIPYENPLIDNLGLVLGLACGIATFFISEVVNRRILATKEDTARALLKSVLPPQETLLAFVLGFTGPSRAVIAPFARVIGTLVLPMRSKWYYLGVTSQSLAVVRVHHNKPTGESRVWPRSQVLELSFDRPAFSEPRITIQFSSEQMVLRVEDSAFIDRADELERVWNRRH